MSINRVRVKFICPFYGEYFSCTCKSRRKTLNVHFKTVWKYAEIEGNWRKKPTKTGICGKHRKEAEITGKTDQIFGSGPKGRGKRGKCQPGGLSGEAGNAPSLLARKGERNPLQGFRATIERTVSNPLRKLYSRNSPQERLLLKV